MEEIEIEIKKETITFFYFVCPKCIRNNRIVDTGKKEIECMFCDKRYKIKGD